MTARRVVLIVSMTCLVMLGVLGGWQWTSTKPPSAVPAVAPPPMTEPTDVAWQTQLRWGQPRRLAGEAMQSMTLVMTPKSCPERCPRIDVSLWYFPQAPDLNAALWQLTRGSDGGAVPTTRTAWAQAWVQWSEQFLSESLSESGGWTRSLSVSANTGFRGWLVLSLHDYHFLGGAHGQTQIQFLNWDAAAQQIMDLNRVIKPQRLDDFWTVVEQAYDDWLRQQEDADSLMENWPFVRTDNVAWLEQQAVVQYQAYDLGPYVLGMPSFELSYADLRGLMR